MPDSGTPEDPISALLRMVTGSGSPDVSAVVPWLRRMMNAASEADPWGAASRQQQPPPPPPPPRPARPAPPRLTPPAAGEEGSRTLYWSLLDLVGDLQRSWGRAGGAPGQADVVDLALKGVMTALNTPAVREQFAPRPLRVVRDEPLVGEFELFRTRSGGFGFRLRDDAGDVLATAKGFDSKQQALDAIAAVRAHASAPVVDTTLDEDAEPIRPVPEPTETGSRATKRAAPSPAGKPSSRATRHSPAKPAPAAKTTKSAKTAAASKAAKSATSASSAKAASRKSTTKATKTARKATKPTAPEGAAANRAAPARPAAKRGAPKPAPEPFESD